WQGHFRPPLKDAPIPPRPERPLPIWIATGGTESSVVRAGELGLPLVFANISLMPARLAPLAGVYRRTAAQAGHSASGLKTAVAAHLHVQSNSQDAMNTFYPYYSDYFRTHTPTQYSARQITRPDYEQLAGPEGPLFVGSPQQIIDKIHYEKELFGHQRFIVQIDIGGLPYPKVADVIQ